MNNVIFNDANYLIRKFNMDNIDICYLKVNFLMYLFEGYYMNKYNKERLYEGEYLNFSDGPRFVELTNYLIKKYGECNKNIVLEGDDCDKIYCFSEKKKVLIDEIYEKYKNYSLSELIKVVNSYSYPGDYVGPYEVIPKICIKKWYYMYLL